MSLENVHEEVPAERSPAALNESGVRAGGVSSQPLNVVAFKFGGSSLLGAERMLHAASLVRTAAAVSNVTVIVSAMKGVTDHLLSIARALADGKLVHARREVDEGGEPDVVMASAGDIPTQEALAATDLLRKEFPDLKIRFINVIDLFKLQPASEHPHGLSDREFDSLFTVDKPVMFNFHGYPQLIHRLAYRRTNHSNIHVRGYKEKGSINTPLELAIDNNIDRFSLAMDVVDRVPRLQRIGGHAKERFLNQQIACRNYAHQYGIDMPEATDWTWPY